MSWVMPADGYHSDHSGNKSTAGPSWVAYVVNAIGQSKYWNSTAILLTWDDWGGWYDHVPPVLLNSYELGFRVPLVIISPYAKTGGTSSGGYISTCSTSSAVCSRLPRRPRNTERVAAFDRRPRERPLRRL